MKTLYVDVYFLINFVVDLLSLYFSARIMRLPISAIMLIASSVFGGVFAVICVLLEPQGILYVLIYLLFPIIIALMCTKGFKVKRKITFGFIFIIHHIRLLCNTLFGFFVRFERTYASRNSPFL